MRTGANKSKVIDLLGDIFEIEPENYKLFSGFPFTTYKNYLIRYSKDRLSEHSINILYTIDRKHWAIAFYQEWSRCYILYKAKYLGYDEQYDIRKEYKYARKNSKVPKTNGNNPNGKRIP